MYAKYNYTYKSMLFVLYSYTGMKIWFYKKKIFSFTYQWEITGKKLYSYTCMYTKYNYTYKSMFFNFYY